MKQIATILILITSLTLSAQSNQLIGEYNRTLGKVETHLTKYILILNPDGTFLFHCYTNNKQGIPPEVNKYGKGTWKKKDNLVLLFTDIDNDIDKKYTLDFTNSKARFITKSPRDKTDRVIKTRLQFFQSQIPWIERLRIDKK